MNIACESAASHVELPQPGLGRPDLAAAAMLAVLRVAAAEDPSRQCCSFLGSGLSSKSILLDGQADSYGVASIGNVNAQPELTSLQPGKPTGTQSSQGV